MNIRSSKARAFTAFGAVVIAVLSTLTSSAHADTVERVMASTSTKTVTVKAVQDFKCFELVAGSDDQYKLIKIGTGKLTAEWQVRGTKSRIEPPKKGHYAVRIRNNSDNWIMLPAGIGVVFRTDDTESRGSSVSVYSHDLLIGPHSSQGISVAARNWTGKPPTTWLPMHQRATLATAPPILLTSINEDGEALDCRQRGMLAASPHSS